MPGRYWIAAVGLVLAAFGASLWFARAAPEPAPLVFTPLAETPVSTITVHVSGEVAAAGLVELAGGSRVADAVAAAGGSTRDADLALINLAAALHDGEQVVIPAAGDPVAVGAIATDGRIHVNSATAAELEQLPGVGPVLATRIASHRDEYGLFAAVEDLLDVSGIGEAKLEAMRDSVVLP